MRKLTIKDPVAGFTERESNSKAILNTDMDSLLKYKIQRKRLNGINDNSNEIQLVKNEVNEIKTELSEIKALLLTIAKSNQE